MAGPDLSLLSAAFDPGAEVAAILSVSAALVVLYAVRRGTRMVLDALRGDADHFDEGGFDQDSMSYTAAELKDGRS